MHNHRKMHSYYCGQQLQTLLQTENVQPASWSSKPYLSKPKDGRIDWPSSFLHVPMLVERAYTTFFFFFFPPDITLCRAPGTKNCCLPASSQIRKRIKNEVVSSLQVQSTGQKSTFPWVREIKCIFQVSKQMYLQALSIPSRPSYIVPLFSFPKGKPFTPSVDYVKIEKAYLTVREVLKLQLTYSWKEKIQSQVRPMCKE